MKINPCKYCGKVPEITFDSGFYELACEVYACNNPDIAMGTTEEYAVHMWNKLNPVEEEGRDALFLRDPTCNL